MFRAEEPPKAASASAINSIHTQDCSSEHYTHTQKPIYTPHLVVLLYECAAGISFRQNGTVVMNQFNSSISATN
jgi:hypothetical protein